MKRSSKTAVAVVATAALGLAIAAAFAQTGSMGPAMMMRGMGGPMAARMHGGDAAFPADMSLVHAMLQSHDRITRKVTNLPDGIRTVTESDDPQVAQLIKAHVASMEKRLGEGRVFNLFSPTLPVLFDNKDKIRTVVATTAKGSIVTQTSADAKVVAALQAHATEVSDLAHDGMAAMMRAARASMARAPAMLVPAAAEAGANSQHEHMHHMEESNDAPQHEHMHSMEPPNDVRQAVEFPVELKQHTLENMRDHLLTLQRIQDALAKGSFDAAAEISESRLGLSSLQLHGAHEVAKYMPQGMQDAGTAMHKAASRLSLAAQNAGATGDVKPAIAALSEVTAQCVACHAAYRLK